MLDPVVVQVVKKCQKNPAFFITNFCRVKHPSAGIIPFHLFKYQKRCLKDFLKHRFNIFRKTRQCGISTLSGVYVLWYAMFFSNKTILIVSKRDQDAIAFMEKNIKFVYQHLPQWMKDLWPIAKENEHELAFTNGSQIKSLTSSPDTLRSNSASLYILDEAAFMPHMDKMWAGGWSTLQHGGNCIVISTTNGMGNWYYQTWQDCNSKPSKNDFNPITINWWDMDWEITFRDASGVTHTISPCAGIRKCENSEEIKKYGPYWSPWLEREYRGLTQGGQSNKFRQEVLAEFLGTGNTVLPRDALMYVESTVNSEYSAVEIVNYYNPVTNERSKLDFQNKLWVWSTPLVSIETPLLSHTYVIGADVASGQAEDWSTAVIVDINDRRQVAELQIKALPKIFARMLDYLGRLYNNALLVVERTGMGHSVIEDLNDELSYPNLYRNQKETSNLKKKYMHYGFNTQRSTKPTLNKALLDYVADGGYVFQSVRLLGEFQIYVQLGLDTRAEPGDGNHDDLVIAAALALIGSESAFSGNSHMLTPFNLSVVEQFRDDIQGSMRRFLDLGGRNVLLPVSLQPQLRSLRSIDEQLEEFARQIGGIHADRRKQSDTRSPVVARKNVLNHSVRSVVVNKPPEPGLRRVF